MTKFYIFLLRAFVGAAFAVVLTRFFYPDAAPVHIIGLGIILVGIAYFAEYLRRRKSR